MAKQKVDATERGVNYFKQITGAYLAFALDVLEHSASPKEVYKLGLGFGRDARLVIRAAELELLDGTESDYWEILKAMECARIKDDDKAQAVFLAAMDDASIGWDQLKMMVREANANGIAPKDKRKTVDVHARIKAAITAWMMEADYNLLDSEVDDLAVQIETALESDARRGARKE